MIAWDQGTALWWPAYDRQDKARALKFIKARLTDSDLAIPHCRQRQLCVQAGGMIGLWPARLARSFAKVLTFEPDPFCLCALQQNVKDANVTARGCALGAAIGTAMMAKAPSSGSWRFRPHGTCEVQVITVDSLELPACDAIVLDIEGHETEALRGATRTIEKFRPVLMVEEWDLAASGAYMREIGYRNVHRVHRDAIYVSAS